MDDSAKRVKVQNVLRIISFPSITYVYFVTPFVCFEKTVLTYCNKAVVHAKENMSNSDAHNATNTVACSTKCKIFAVPNYNVMTAYEGIHEMDMNVVNFTIQPIDPWHSLDWGTDVMATLCRETATPSASIGWRDCPQIQYVFGGREKKIRHRGISSLLR
jgi:hypothetical protein